MITISLPPVEKLLFKKNNNVIWQSFNSLSSIIESCELVSRNPFVIKSGEDTYFLTSNETENIPDEILFAVLTLKKPTKKDFDEGNIKISRWIKHPHFLDVTTDEVINSWKDNFKFIKEDTENGIEGLRPPQIGALYSILAHIQNPDDRGIVVMPTGTGKTEVMLSALIANQCEKLLVAVPSESLRTQLQISLLL